MDITITRTYQTNPNKGTDIHSRSLDTTKEGSVTVAILSPDTPLAQGAKV